MGREQTSFNSFFFDKIEQTQLKKNRRLTTSDSGTRSIEPPNGGGRVEGGRGGSMKSVRLAWQAGLFSEGSMEVFSNYVMLSLSLPLSLSCHSHCLSMR